MNLRTNERGSSLVELCWSLTVLISVFSGMMIITYLCFAKIWLGHASYETLICLASKIEKSRCESTLRTQVSSALPVGNLIQAQAQVSDSCAQIDLRFAVSEKIQIAERQAIKLPLHRGIQ